MRLKAFFSLVIPLLGWAAAASATDWSQWGGTDMRNMSSDERGIPAVFEPGKKASDGSGIDLRTTRNVRWVAKLGNETYSSPAVAGGRVFIGTSDSTLADPRFERTGGGVLLCLDEATGRLVWRLVVPRLTTGHKSVDFDAMGLGICSSPAVDGDRVYVVTNRDEVLCLDAQGMANGNDGPFTDERHYWVPAGHPPVEPGPQDADIIWRFDMTALPVFPHDAAASSVLVHDDVVYVGTANGVDHKKPPFPGAPSLIALDKRTGRLLAADNEGIGARTFHGQWSSPSLGRVGGRPLVFFGGGDGVCYAFDAVTAAAGSRGFLHKLWSYDCTAPYRLDKYGKPVDYWSGDKREDRGNLDDGRCASPCEIIGTPAFYKNRVYVAIGQDPQHGRGRGLLTCIDAAKAGDIAGGGKIWSYDKIDRSLSSVSVAGGLVYAADMPGRVHCLDAETGQCYWVYDCKSDIWTSTLVVDGKVFVGTAKGLWVLAAGKHPQVLATIRLGSPIRSMPVVADGTLFVASQRYLWAIGDAGLNYASVPATKSGHALATHPAATSAQQGGKHTL
ncbi:MAG: PQQ-binding-like beta-propeller repeat protein [Thermoguttaceae bacterium]|jgi:outer membrane protein assembly factor BamB